MNQLFATPVNIRFWRKPPKVLLCSHSRESKTVRKRDGSRSRRQQHLWPRRQDNTVGGDQLHRGRNEWAHLRVRHWHFRCVFCLSPLSSFICCLRMRWWYMHFRRWGRLKWLNQNSSYSKPQMNYHVFFLEQSTRKHQSHPHALCPPINTIIVSAPVHAEHDKPMWNGLVMTPSHVIFASSKMPVSFNCCHLDESMMWDSREVVRVVWLLLIQAKLTSIFALHFFCLLSNIFKINTITWLKK